VGVVGAFFGVRDVAETKVVDAMGKRLAGDFFGERSLVFVEEEKAAASGDRPGDRISANSNAMVAFAVEGGG
jgi:hypothetical protein